MTACDQRWGLHDRHYCIKRSRGNSKPFSGEYTLVLKAFSESVLEKKAA